MLYRSDLDDLGPDELRERIHHHPKEVRGFVVELAGDLLSYTDRVDVVIATSEDLAITQPLVEILGCKMGVVEEVTGESAFSDLPKWRRLLIQQHNLKRGESVVLVDDVITGLERVQAVIEIVRDADAKPVSLASLISFCPFRRFLTNKPEEYVPIKALSYREQYRR